MGGAYSYEEIVHITITITFFTETHRYITTEVRNSLW